VVCVEQVVGGNESVQLVLQVGDGGEVSLLEKLRDRGPTNGLE